MTERARGNESSAELSAAFRLQREEAGGQFSLRADARAGDALALMPAAGAEPGFSRAQEARGQEARGQGGRAQGVDEALLARFRGPGRLQQVALVRGALSAAVEAWWDDERLPPDALLRDGLLLLEAGYTLDEMQRTLLARTALARGRGMLTALRHLGDPERAAGLLHEGVQRGVLGPGVLRRLLREEPESAVWGPLLANEVRADLASPLRDVAERAEVVLQVMYSFVPDGALPIVSPSAPAGAGRGGVRLVEVDELPERRGRWRGVVVSLLLVGLALLVVGGWWQGRSMVEMLVVPGGRYVANREDGGSMAVALAPFLVDRTEVTNGAWALCVRRGGCVAPVPAGSATREAYYGNPEYAEYPVVHVTQAEAAAYCSMLGKRLPSAAEWQVAAAFAPATQRMWRYPWGQAFQAAFVTGGSGQVDTAPVGARSPQGDGPLGAADMAGNVAEWTGTPAGAPPDTAVGAFVGSVHGVDAGGAFVVKGGSYASGPAELQPGAAVVQGAETRAPWLGFRCVMDAP